MTGALPSWAEGLGLQAHPEGGWYAETYRHAGTFTPGSPYDGARNLGTGIYFLLLPGESSAWHRVRSDELWLWHRGGPLTLSLGGDAQSPGVATDLTLGPAVEDGQRPQGLVPGGHWQAARPAADEPVLVSCVVVPGFDFADFELQDDH
ncbi:cupin domain-containing protein [Flexivirga sp. ID2601S]|uniref:Cupin domain-containing protein n=1 Tax=Flexivirga aerilata TaxID=1656889 RepID=A0A849AKM4_9MICO|nr:cupin domain-containing protein [Flexivirga aerilata]NNG40919.1 cupin domain-containing protein [Flexivirga aerilata]